MSHHFYRSTVNTPKLSVFASKYTTMVLRRDDDVIRISKGIRNICWKFHPFSILSNPFSSFSTFFNLKWPWSTFFDLRWPQITVFSCTNRFYSVFPFTLISESFKIVSEWVFIDSRKKIVPKHSGFHGEKPTSGFEVPTGSRKVPHAIARVKLYMSPKFHANRSTRLGGESLSHIKWTAS